MFFKVVDEKIIQAANSKDSPLVMLTFKSCGVLLVRKRQLRTSRLDIDRDRCRSDSLSSVSSLSASWESSKEIEADTLGLEVLLLTKHGCGKFDLPKGHMEIGETEIQTVFCRKPPTSVDNLGIQRSKRRDRDSF